MVRKLSMLIDDIVLHNNELANVKLTNKLKLVNDKLEPSITYRAWLGL